MNNNIEYAKGKEKEMLVNDLAHNQFKVIYDLGESGKTFFYYRNEIYKIISNDDFMKLNDLIAMAPSTEFIFKTDKEGK